MPVLSTERPRRHSYSVAIFVSMDFTIRIAANPLSEIVSTLSATLLQSQFINQKFVCDKGTPDCADVDEL